jgi:murein L,D-transpeptidase YcbB/YkuD
MCIGLAAVESFDCRRIEHAGRAECNLPDYTLRVMRQGKQVWMARIIAGKPATPTPVITAQMKSITVNPIWNVPASIANNEYLPLLAAGPHDIAADGAHC